MRYAEQLRYSWDYNWSIFREIWDMFTLHKKHWIIVGLLVAICVIPSVVSLLPATTHYYTTTPIPTFAPSLSQELAITDYYSKAMPVPSIPAVISYYWIRGSRFVLFTNILCLMSMGLLLFAWLREK